MPLLDTFKTQQQSFELVLPGKGPLDTHPQRMDRCVEEAFASALRGLTVAWVLFDVGDHASVENTLAIRPRVKAAVEIDIGPSEVQPDLFGYLLQRFQTLGQ